jgi:hypothetical protein
MGLVLPCLKCSRGYVREVFNVMAQVDHDLTTVNCVDQQLRLIKNLGQGLRMCIDYTNLNKLCPKDPFPLPRITR